MGAIEELVAGNFFQSVVTPITNIIPLNVFYLLLYFSILGLLFMRTKSMGVVMVALFVSSFAVVPSIYPPAQKYLAILIVVGFVFVVIDIFIKKR